MQSQTAQDSKGIASKELETDELFHLLSNARRRAIIQHLDRDGPLSKSDLAGRVAATENNKPPKELTSQEKKRVLVSIHQVHLCKLVDAGVIRVEGNDEINLNQKAQDLLWYLDNGPHSGGILRTFADWL